MKRTDARLAFREEGRNWNCYIAKQSTMEGAILLGSIMMRPAEENEELKRRFMALMQDTFAYVLKDALGIEIDHWGEPTPAPAKDRTKPS